MKKKLGNNKYFSGKYTDSGQYGGWFIGSFFKDQNNPCKTDLVEVMYREHKAGYVAKPHYHKEKIELIIILEGKAKYIINGKDIILESGDFLFIDKNNIIAGEFLEPSKIFAIHSPSIVSDKFLS